MCITCCQSHEPGLCMCEAADISDTVLLPALHTLACSRGFTLFCLPRVWSMSPHTGACSGCRGHLNSIICQSCACQSHLKLVHKKPILQGRQGGRACRHNCGWRYHALHPHSRHSVLRECQPRDAHLRPTPAPHLVVACLTYMSGKPHALHWIKPSLTGPQAEL